MKLIMALLFLVFSFSVSANDTLYFRLSNPWNTVKDPNGKYLRKCVMEKGYYHVWDYNSDKQLVTESYYADTSFKTKLLCHKYYHEPGGWLEQTRCYVNGRLDGYFVSYNKNGDTTGYDIYKEGQPIKSWSSHPEEKDTVMEALIKLEKQAEFPGGRQGWLKYLSNNLEYPSSLKDKTIKGEVIVSFTVNTNGMVENVKIVKSLNPDLDSEAIRVIQKSPKWKPASQTNKYVPAYMTQSIRF